MNSKLFIFALSMWACKHLAQVQSHRVNIAWLYNHSLVFSTDKDRKVGLKVLSVQCLKYIFRMPVFILPSFCNGSGWTMQTIPCPSPFPSSPPLSPSHPPVITRPDEAVKQVAREFKMTEKRRQPNTSLCAKEKQREIFACVLMTDRGRKEGGHPKKNNNNKQNTNLVSFFFFC